MKPRSLLALLLVLGVAGVCVKLGFWQLSRLSEKRAMNQAQRVALAASPVRIGAGGTPSEVLHRRVIALGRYDDSRHVILFPRSNAGSPGVDVVTPLLLEGSTGAVLVDRGWLYDPSGGGVGATDTRPLAEPGLREVIGIAEPMRRGAGGMPIRSVGVDSVALHSARWLDFDSLSSRFPYALEPFVIRQLPGAGVPQKPLRRPAQPANEAMHASYAAQWFLFAVIVLVGSAILAATRMRRAASPTLDV